MVDEHVGGDGATVLNGAKDARPSTTEVADA